MLLVTGTLLMSLAVALALYNIYLVERAIDDNDMLLIFSVLGLCSLLAVVSFGFVFLQGYQTEQLPWIGASATTFWALINLARNFRSRYLKLVHITSTLLYAITMASFACTISYRWDNDSWGPALQVLSNLSLCLSVLLVLGFGTTLRECTRLRADSASQIGD